jgi:hypothetical protein
LRENARIEENAAAIAQFFTVSPEVARDLAQPPNLFVD